MWQCWYCDCTNSEELGRCQYCSGPRRGAKREIEGGELKWTYVDEDEYWSPYYFKSGVSIHFVPSLYAITHTGYTEEKEVEEPVEDAYFAPAPKPKRWKIFNFFRRN